MDTIKECAISFAKSEVLGAAAVEGIAKELGETPSFARWNEVREAFLPAYKGEKKCADDAAAKAWERMARRLADTFDLAKPTAPSAAATKKSAERDKAKKEEEALVKKHGGSAQALLKVAASAAKAGKHTQASAATKAAMRANKLADTSIKNAMRAQWDSVLKACRAAKSANDVKLLKKVKKIFSIV